ncbi:glycosyltransferase [Mycobacterium palustre]|uniref:Glycosyltransferase n=1 Tax=Mycobacterium palustre TaxID=153971 RepID=A0A1X1Z2X4_9MYCO|nr:nucleotide disphospho-sugar-binding domain-containing protein [Mycobacterium palustre]MCV7099646.1 glycosyltransferase [Mycobacterium palustre]ORW17689.1 glycosyltransferase [Mycobacterium palustre]
MRFVLACYGSRGDVEPFAALARELAHRGHQVSLAVPPYMVGFVESAGLAATNFGPDPPASTAQNPIHAVTEIVGHLTEACAQWGATLAELGRGADLLVTGRGEQGLAANVAEYHGIPAVALHFFPGDGHRPSGLIGQVTRDAEDAQRRRLGLDPTTEAPETALEIQAYDQIGFPELAAAWAEQGRRRPFVGALTLQLPTDADEDVASWIAHGPPPIYFGFGSAVRFASSAATVAVIAAACARLGERALICTGPNDVTGQSEDIKVVAAVNHSAILPACRAVVHHGGAGTTAAGMRAGIPTLILWHEIDDQPVWAAAVERLEVGIGRPFWSASEQSLVADLRSILTAECTAKAREVGAKTTTADESVAMTADLLEDTARAGT